MPHGRQEIPESWHRACIPRSPVEEEAPGRDGVAMPGNRQTISEAIEGAPGSSIRFGLFRAMM
jgi:hypothetical protein